ncbi:MAG TPA: hypothetical protein VHO70_08025 [Chitinispirillaceae bacterium]|nr:hypothetical protein [Chitinispirillaceae bacterium]
MAQRLQSTHSPDYSVKAGKRHQRLSFQVKGAEFLAEAIKGPITLVEEKIKAKEDADDKSDQLFDLINLYDSEQDNKIRTVASRCKEYDRDNPGARTYETIFPNNTGAIIDANVFDEPEEVKKVAARIQSLGPDHILSSLGATLTEAADRVKQAINQHLESITEVGKADAELQIAKSVLVKQYLSNMFEAEKMFGRKGADRLFPKLSGGSSSQPSSPAN